MNHTIVNMAHSARERLKNMAKASGRDADYLFQRYAFERFFYRIGQSPYADRFILKGAVARIRDFLSPVVSGETRPGLVWSPQTKQWENGDTPASSSKAFS